MAAISLAEAQGGQACHPLLQVVLLWSLLVRSIGLVSEDTRVKSISLVLSMSRRYLLGDKIPRDCAYFIAHNYLYCLGRREEGSMAGTMVELSENGLQNLLYEQFCHLVQCSRLLKLLPHF